MEVAARNVNHFPDGVFQRCRVVVQREKEAERERLRKIRRLKTKIVPLSQFPAFSTGATAVAGSDSPSGSQLSLLPPTTGSQGSGQQQEALWLLEQQYDIESPRTSRPQSRSVRTTPLMTPSPARVHPVTSNALLDAAGGGLDSPAGLLANISSRGTPSSSGRYSAGPSGRVVPSAVYSTTIPLSGIGTGSARNSGVGIAGSIASGNSSPARPFSTIEQQMLYQQGVMASTRGSGVSLLPPTGAAGTTSPPLLLGSPLMPSRGRMASWRDPALNR